MLGVERVREVKNETRGDGRLARRAAIARNEKDLHGSLCVERHRVHRRGQTEHDARGIRFERTEEQHDVPVGDREIVHVGARIEFDRARLVHHAVGRHAVDQHLLLLTHHDAEREQLTGGVIEFRMGGERTLLVDQPVRDRVVEQAPAEIMAIDDIERLGIDDVRKPAFPEREQLACVRDDVGVRRVLESHAQRVREEAARDQRAEAAVEHEVGEALAQVLTRANEAIAIANAARAELESQQHAVAVEQMPVLHATPAKTPWAVVKEHAAHCVGDGAHEDLERCIDLARDVAMRVHPCALDGIQAFRGAHFWFFPSAQLSSSISAAVG